jgi:MoxR-like ATPase
LAWSSSRQVDRVSETWSPTVFDDAEAVSGALESVGYLPDHGISTSVLLAARLRRPLLLEGEPGVGKTELAKALAQIVAADLVRLQCFEGIEASEALYEWDWRRQLLVSRAGNPDAATVYAPEFLLERPLLRALREGARTVLLIDELDRADDEFDAFLLEMLSDFTVTIPELGTIAAETPPLIVITSNRTRELHDALTRRCLYHWIDYPSVEREVEIISVRAPEVAPTLARSVAEVVARLRTLGLVKPPGASEAIDWARCLAIVGAESVLEDVRTATDTLGAAIKNHDDLRRVRAELPALYRG